MAAHKAPPNRRGKNELKIRCAGVIDIDGMGKNGPRMPGHFFACPSLTNLLDQVKSGFCNFHEIQSQIMKTKPVLSAEDVKAILAAAEKHALENQWAVSIAVVDDGGHLLGLLRLDNAAPITAHMAPAKANAAALGRRESKVYEDIINQGRMSFLTAPVLEGLLEGGVPIIVDGQVVGAVAAAGVKSSDDAAIARAGIAAVTA